MDYQKQAKDFLQESKVLFYATKAVPQKSPLWATDGKHGIHWSITLATVQEGQPFPEFQSRIMGDDRRFFDKEIEFSFWGSIADKEKAEHSIRGTKPTPYDVLSGVYSPVTDFQDFCGSFGYDSDSRKAEQTYNLVKELNAKIESIFRPEQIEQLQEIQ